MAKCPFAVWDEISGPVGSYTGGPFKIVHHTTEGSTFQSARAAFRQNRSDPHFTVDSTTIYQHIDTDLAARSLRNLAGGVQTNRDRAVQIEIVAFAGKPKDPKTLANVARLCRWIERQHGIPQVWPSGYPKPAVNGRDPGHHNRSGQNWTSMGGHYGHCHVPENIHWDPAYTAAEVAAVMADAEVMPTGERFAAPGKALSDRFNEAVASALSLSCPVSEDFLEESVSVPVTNHVHLRRGKFFKTTPDDLNTLFRNFEADPNRNNLVVHFHGGLIGGTDGLAIADRLLGLYKDSSAYPVFFVWESGLYPALLDALLEVGKDELFKRLLHKIAKWLAKKLGFSFPIPEGLEVPPGGAPSDNLDFIVWRELRYPDLGGAPFSMFDAFEWAEAVEAGAELPVDPSFEDQLELQYELETDPVIAAEIAALVASALSEAASAPDVPTRPRLSAAALETVRADAFAEAVPVSLIMNFVKVGVRTFRRYRKGRWHGFHATLVEELLREFYAGDVAYETWSKMKEYTEDSFNTDPSKYGGTAFLAGLKRIFDTGAKPRITLVGHSAGSIYICHFLRAAKAMIPNVNFDVVFLAPAVTFKLFGKTLDESAGSIGRFRSFAMGDDLERRDTLVPAVPFLYPSSLLYLVSGICESDADEPLVGMQRYYSKMKPYDPKDSKSIRSVLDFLATKPDSTIWSKTAADAKPGLRTLAEHHGDFDNEGATLESVMHLLHSGFEETIRSIRAPDVEWRNDSE